MKKPTLVHSRGPLNDLYTEKLKSSGLSEKDAKKLGYSLLTAEEAESLGKGVQRRASLKIPYLDPIKGTPTEFFRVRYLEPARGIKTEASDRKYGQLSKSMNELYVPNLINWALYRQDRSIPLVLTEGELKAAKACAMGIHCVGIGGVWNFKSRQWDVAILEEFESLSLEGREVHIVFDSDARQNPDVSRAAKALARALLGFKATPKLSCLPSITPNGKTGLDDYLLVRTVEDFKHEVLSRAEVFGPLEDVLALNDEIAYVRSQDKIYSYRDRKFYKPESVIKNLLGPRRKLVRISEKQEKWISIAAEWLCSPFRTEYDTLTYVPGYPRSHEGSLNMWPGWGTASEKGDVKLFLTLIDHLCSDEDEAAKHWLLQWLAYPIQNPGAKLFSSLYLWSRNTGTGKTLLGYTMGRVYGENYKEIVNDTLTDARKYYALYRQFILGDELKDEGSNVKITELIKSLVTGETIHFEPKFMDPVDLRNTINFMFTSQWPDSIKLEEYDRRMFVLNPEEKFPEDLAKAYDRWYRTHVGGGVYKSGPGIPAVLYYLAHYDLAGFSPQGPAYQTSARATVVEVSRSELATTTSQLRDDPDSILCENNGLSGGAMKTLPYCLWRLEDLLKVLDPEDKRRYTTPRLAKELLRAGFKKVSKMQCRTKRGQYMLWRLRPLPVEVKGWKSWGLAEWGAFYDEERGLAALDNQPKKRKF